MEDSGLVSTVLGWAVEAGVFVVMMAVSWVAARFGLNLSEARKDQLRSRLGELVKNGLIWAASKLGIPLDGKVTEEEKHRIINLAATDYMPDHGAETVKKLGGDAKDVATMQQIVAARAPQVLDVSMAAPAVVIAPVQASAELPIPSMPPVSRTPSFRP